MEISKFWYVLVFLICSAANANVLPYLTSDEVSEGPCMDDVTPFLAVNLNPIWFAIPRSYYVPIASEGCYRHYAEVLLGRPAKSQEELHRMKLKVPLLTAFPAPVFITYGFDNKTRLTQTCPALNMAQGLCVPLVGSRKTDLAAIRTSLNSIVYTDNETTLLIVRCVNGQRRDYKVLTVEPDVPPAVQDIIAERIIGMGFNISLMSIHNYFV